MAEDNPVNQKLATIVLQKMGHRVDVADNLEWNEYRGEKRLQLNVRSLQPSA